MKLKEINSLEKAKLAQLKEIQGQESRRLKIKERMEEAAAEKEQLARDVRALKGQLADAEAKLKNLDTQKQRLQDLGGDEAKVSSFQQQIEQIEEEALLCLDTIDRKESELQDAEQFLQGIRKTLEEIGLEVDEEKAKAANEIAQYELRLSLLINELPSDFKQAFERVQKKQLAHGGFTKIESGQCLFCRYKLSRVEESEIDIQQKLKMCSQCGRIFLPYGA